MDRGVGGSGELYPNVIWMFGCLIFLTLQGPLYGTVLDVN